ARPTGSAAFRSSRTRHPLSGPALPAAERLFWLPLAPSSRHRLSTPCGTLLKLRVYVVGWALRPHGRAVTSPLLHEGRWPEGRLRLDPATFCRLVHLHCLPHGHRYLQV